MIYISYKLFTCDVIKLQKLIFILKVKIFMWQNSVIKLLLLLLIFEYIVQKIMCIPCPPKNM